MKTNQTQAIVSSTFSVRCSMFDVLLPLLLLLASAGAGLSQPVITNQPYTQATALGTTATYTVGARGPEPLAYRVASASVREGESSHRIGFVADINDEATDDAKRVFDH